MNRKPQVFIDVNNRYSYTNENTVLFIKDFIDNSGTFIDGDILLKIDEEYLYYEKEFVSLKRDLGKQYRAAAPHTLLTFLFLFFPYML